MRAVGHSRAIKYISLTYSFARSHIQDTHDLFATLVVSLRLGTNTRFFRSYPNTFTTDDAAANLSSLRFSQSNRSADPNDPQRIITTTTTTTFTMSREIAKGICQQFMDARLIENAADPTVLSFKDRGIYSITPKGLHVLERFITKNGIAADHLVRVFTTQPICMRLLTLERRPNDDDLIVTRPVMELVFRRFVGGSKGPNYVVDPSEPARFVNLGSPRGFQESVRLPPTFDRSNGVEMQDVAEKNPRNPAQAILVKNVFGSATAIDWLCDHSTCTCRDEAAEILAHFVRFGFITLAFDKNRAAGNYSDSSSGSGSSSAGAAAAAAGPRLKEGQTIEAEFRWGPKVTYRVTDEGRRLAGWDNLSIQGVGGGGAGSKLEKKKVSSDSADDASNGRSIFGQGNGSSNSLHGHALRHGGGGGMKDEFANSSAVGGEWSLAGGVGVGNMLDAQLLSKLSLKEIFDVDDANNWTAKDGQAGHSSTTRLRAILEDIRLRALFREFLKSNYCEENLGFWLDVQDFRRRFSTTSSAAGGGPGSSSSSSGAGGGAATQPATQPKKPLLRGITFGNSSSQSANASNAMEAHQNDLNIAAVNIYRLYLAPQSPSELNIDHNLRADVVNFITKCADEAGIPLSTLSAPRNLLSSGGAGGGGAGLSGAGTGGAGGGGGAPLASPDLGAGAAGAQHQLPGGAGGASSETLLGGMQNQMVLPLRATQVQTLLRYYERIQDHIFRLLATDQVPRFVRTPEFVVLLGGPAQVSFCNRMEAISSF